MSYSYYEHSNDETDNFTRLRWLIDSFVELIVTPEVSLEALDELDELSTEIVERIAALGNSEYEEHLTEELTSYISECISECDAEEIAAYKIDWLISACENDAD